MSEQHHHLANKCKDIVDLQGRRRIVSPRAQFVIITFNKEVVFSLCFFFVNRIIQKNYSTNFFLKNSAERQHVGTEETTRFWRYSGSGSGSMNI